MFIEMLHNRVLIKVFGIVLVQQKIALVGVFCNTEIQPPP